MASRIKIFKNFPKKELEAPVFLILFFLFFGYISYRMGLTNAVNTIMSTAHNLVLNSALYLMGVMVLTSALARLFVEFGILTAMSSIERILSFILRPLFNLPGSAFVAGFLAFLSDNTAFMGLTNNHTFTSKYRKYELISLVNFGTTFGMGLIIMTSMLGLKPNGNVATNSFFTPVIIGVISAIIGGIISTRLLQVFCKKEPSMNDFCQNIKMATTFNEAESIDLPVNLENIEEITSSNNSATHGYFSRFLNGILDGGKIGVELGLSIIPGIIIITTFVMLLTNGEPSNGYTGGLGEGVGILPFLANKVSSLLELMFGFTNEKIIAYPLTVLGSAGSAIALAKDFVHEGIAGPNEVAVFTAMGICWSGFLCTHTAMFDALGYRKFTSIGVFTHTFGGICSGVIAHYIYLLFC